jgi:hypothetical protein
MTLELTLHRALEVPGFDAETLCDCGHYTSYDLGANENKVAAREGHPNRRCQAETVGGSRRLKSEGFWEAASPLPQMGDPTRMALRPKMVEAVHRDRLPLGVYHELEG